jgi:hypothetical protein
LPISASSESRAAASSRTSATSRPASPGNGGGAAAKLGTGRGPDIGDRMPRTRKVGKADAHPARRARRTNVRHGIFSQRAPEEHVQPDLTYVGEAQDQRLARFQEVGGKPTRQEFPISGEGGLQKASEHQEGRPAEYAIDGVPLPAMLQEQTLEWIGPDNGGRSTTHLWVLRDRPQILLKRQEGHNHWSITSVSAIRRIGDTSYRCLETVQRNISADGYFVITQDLSAQVPGHLVEQIQRHYKSSAPKPVLVIHERVVDGLSSPVRAGRPRVFLRAH